MKITSRHIERDGSGRVTLVPEEDEDMYHLYNLIEPGDLVRAAAVRRVQSESNTGSIESHRVKLTLTIEVTKTSFDTSASSAPPDPTAVGGDGGDANAGSSANPLNALGGGGGGDGVTLQVTGRVAEENNFVKMGAYHTLDLEPQRSLTITKASWDSVHLERLGEASDVGSRAEVGAVVLGDGTAVVCILTEHMTIVRQRIDVSLPRKRKGISGATDKSLARFHAQVYTAITKLLSLPALRLVILASPGFIKDTVYEYLFSEGQKRGDKMLIGNEARRKFLKIHCNSPHLHSLMEVLRSPEVSAQLKDTKFAREGLLLDKFLRMLNTDELRAWYGEKHVALAAERGAVGTLLISDGLFRNADPNRRRKFVQLVEDVRKTGGEAAIFSSMHESGRQLNGLTGIAAILTYPLDVEIVEEEEREAEEQAAAEAKEGGEQRRKDFAPSSAGDAEAAKIGHGTTKVVSAEKAEKIEAAEKKADKEFIAGGDEEAEDEEEDDEYDEEDDEDFQEGEDDDEEEGDEDDEAGPEGAEGENGEEGEEEEDGEEDAEEEAGDEAPAAGTKRKAAGDAKDASDEKKAKKADK
ncbi:hypothetical protein A4X13_0g2677 [Tilletia indica]|uniref:eRF1/Pelota-like N-terminal domain-containing protein n=1 Tax=Tilletia indica TaxID=43049 RepID=A0A8T8T4X0_9BASI|nr:hypothetical protein A4X13_0g2677 [Tilletia indica]